MYKRQVQWLSGEFKPDVVVLTNMLIAGCAPAIKERLQAKIVVTLQGDDIFLDGLTQPYKTQAFREIKAISKSVDAYITASEYYADYMADYLAIDRAKIHVVPLAIDVADFAEFAPPRPFDGRYPILGAWVVNGQACGLGIREDDGVVTRNTSRFVPHRMLL